MSMVNRTFLLSHSKYHRNNFNFIIKTFLDNDYPINFIFDQFTIKVSFKTYDRTHIALIRDETSI
ncbi:hypothetical protein ALC56_09854 [Trachymyrmex septentrionalis]|uniref:Helix-turn-helix domain-containing protein n=1 Tax=Trachymyrmex septentrionalis TaxID=34720 RepID=A0A151JU78_9HYME|nr:hypothetical protein ALC56_09854 [Trachymyrmex septentrionalis]